MHSRGFDGFQIPPLLLWSSSEHIHSGTIEASESASSIIQKIHRGPQQGNEMDDFFPFLCIHGTFHSNMLSLYSTFPWYLAWTRRLRPLFPFGKLASGDKEAENKKKKRTGCWWFWLTRVTLDLLCDLCLSVLVSPISLGLQALLKTIQFRKNMTKQKQLSLFKLHACSTSNLSFISPFPQFDPLPFAVCVSIAGKGLWLQEFLHSCHCPTEMSFGQQDQAVNSCLHTDETGGGWCHLASLRIKPQERLSRRRPFCPPSHRTRCGDPTVQWNREVGFCPLIIAWESQASFFLCASFSHC